MFRVGDGWDDEMLACSDGGGALSFIYMLHASPRGPFHAPRTCCTVRKPGVNGFGGREPRADVASEWAVEMTVIDHCHEYCPVAAHAQVECTPMRL